MYTSVISCTVMSDYSTHSLAFCSLYMRQKTIVISREEQMILKVCLRYMCSTSVILSWPPAGTEYVADSFRLVFPSVVNINSYLHNSNTVSLPESVKCANVTILDDNILEQNTFKMFTMHLNSADSAANFSAPNTTSVNIFDNDCTCSVYVIKPFWYA